MAALRTPIGTAGRGLAGVTAPELAAPVISALVARRRAGRAARGRGARPASREVVLGNCMGPGGDVARVAALAAGPARLSVTSRRSPSTGSARSGLAASCRRGRLTPCAPSAGVVLAGGVESASTAPWRFWPPAPGRPTPVRYERAPFAPAAIGDPDMGLADDLLAAGGAASRAHAQDDYAARSHARAVATPAAGGFDDELVPVGGRRARRAAARRADRRAAGPAAAGVPRRTAR